MNLKVHFKIPTQDWNVFFACQVSVQPVSYSGNGSDGFVLALKVKFGSCGATAGILLAYDPMCVGVFQISTRTCNFLRTFQLPTAFLGES